MFLTRLLLAVGDATAIMSQETCSPFLAPPPAPFPPPFLCVWIQREDVVCYREVATNQAIASAGGVQGVTVRRVRKVHHSLRRRKAVAVAIFTELVYGGWGGGGQ